MKLRDLLKTMFVMTLVVLSFGPGAAYCFQDSDVSKNDNSISAAINAGGVVQGTQLVQTGGVIRIVADAPAAGARVSRPRLAEAARSPAPSSGIVAIDNINIEPTEVAPTGIVSIDNITYDYPSNNKGEIRIAASEELVNLSTETPKANEASERSTAKEVREQSSKALKPVSIPGTRSNAVLQTPTVMPVYNKTIGTAHPVTIDLNSIRHEIIYDGIELRNSEGIGSSILTRAPPIGQGDFLTFKEKLLTKILVDAHKEPGVPYSWDVFSSWRALP